MAQEQNMFVVVDNGVFAKGEVVFGNHDKALVLEKAAQYNAALAPGFAVGEYAVFEMVPVAA